MRLSLLVQRCSAGIVPPRRLATNRGEKREGLRQTVAMRRLTKALLAILLAASTLLYAPLAMAMHIFDGKSLQLSYESAGGFKAKLQGRLDD